MKEKIRNVLRNLPYPDAKYAASFAFSAARLLGGKYRGGQFALGPVMLKENVRVRKEEMNYRCKKANITK